MIFSGNFSNEKIASLFNSFPDGATFIREAVDVRRYVVGMSNDAPTQVLDLILPNDIGMRDMVYEDIESDGLGIWRNPDTGLIELDTVRTFDDYDQAMKFAERQGETCFYDSHLEFNIYTNEQSIAV